MKKKTKKVVYEDCSGCTDRNSEGTHQMHTKQHPCKEGGDPDCGYCFPHPKEKKGEDSEYQKALKLADWVLEQPYCDPDGDLEMMSRQFLRAVEREQRLMTRSTAEPTSPPHDIGDQTPTSIDRIVEEFEKVGQFLDNSEPFKDRSRWLRTTLTSFEKEIKEKYERITKRHK